VAIAGGGLPFTVVELFEFLELVDAVEIVDDCLEGPVAADVAPGLPFTFVKFLKFVDVVDAVEVVEDRRRSADGTLGSELGSVFFVYFKDALFVLTAVVDDTEDVLSRRRFFSDILCGLFCLVPG